ncbi:MAG TPA: hypothetical protein ENN42_00435 [Thioalkalivibrio sp.]|nr:hypothetical protein [Thioalkalivibrio sp.]
MHVFEREAGVIARGLAIPPEAIELHAIPAAGPGNAAWVTVESAGITEVFSAIGRKGLPAERVAGRLVEEVCRYLDADAPVGPHLADQLLLPLALAGGGEFLATALTRHARTNAAVIACFGLAHTRWVESAAGVHFRVESAGEAGD